MSVPQEIKTNSHEALSVLLLLQREAAEETSIPADCTAKLFYRHGKYRRRNIAGM
jgi:hypothetical protein